MHFLMCQMKDKDIPDSVDIITPYPKKDELQFYYLGPSTYTYSHPNLNFLPYTIQILIHVMWSAQAVRDLKIDNTQRHLSALRGTRST